MMDEDIALVIEFLRDMGCDQQAQTISAMAAEIIATRAALHRLQCTAASLAAELREMAVGCGR